MSDVPTREGRMCYCPTCYGAADWLKQAATWMSRIKLELTRIQLMPTGMAKSAQYAEFLTQLDEKADQLMAWSRYVKHGGWCNDSTDDGGE